MRDNERTIPDVANFNDKSPAVKACKSRFTIHVTDLSSR
ncbi:hypothetical protein 18India_47 [Salmonella phage 18-India]|nr:hypothetical protein 18India_47 [Salmonella phage 18-India]